MTVTDRLHQALVVLAAASQRPPCGECGGHELWTSDDRQDRALAAERCQQCRVLQSCGAAADDAGEQWHVWAGVDRTPPPRGQRVAS